MIPFSILWARYSLSELVAVIGISWFIEIEASLSVVGTSWLVETVSIVIVLLRPEALADNCSCLFKKRFKVWSIFSTSG